MDLEHLNKNQVILLALLVSFVTSIATGIVTVSLVNQAPPQVEATVNHIIERTVEQVAAPAAAPSIKTVVVQGDELAMAAIAKVKGSVIRIVDTSAPNLLVARGIIIDAKGVAITDNGSLSSSASYAAILPDGTTVPAAARTAATSTSVALIDLKLSTTTPALVPATFADPAKLQLGQTVIRIGGTGADTVGEGVIAQLPNAAGALAMLEATVPSATPGSVIFTLDGSLVGIMTSDSALQGNDFYSMPSIFKAAAASASASSAAGNSSAAVPASPASAH